MRLFRFRVGFCVGVRDEIEKVGSRQEDPSYVQISAIFSSLGKRGGEQFFFFFSFLFVRKNLMRGENRQHVHHYILCGIFFFFKHDYVRYNCIYTRMRNLKNGTISPS